MRVKEIREKVLILKGRGYILAGTPELAAEAYKEAGIDIHSDIIKNEFADCGDRCLKRGSVLAAAYAYSISKNANGLILVGNEFLKKGDSEGAMFFFREAVNLQRERKIKSR